MDETAALAIDNIIGSAATKDGKVILIKLDAGGLTIDLAFPHAKALELAVILTREADRAALRHG
jgi:hypothetical protein